MKSRASTVNSPVGRHQLLTHVPPRTRGIISTNLPIPFFQSQTTTSESFRPSRPPKPLIPTVQCAATPLPHPSPRKSRLPPPSVQRHPMAIPSVPYFVTPAPVLLRARAANSTLPQRTTRRFLPPHRAAMPLLDWFFPNPAARDAPITPPAKHAVLGTSPKEPEQGWPLPLQQATFGLGWYVLLCAACISGLQHCVFHADRCT